MRKCTYFLGFVSIIAMSACGSNESTSETIKTDSTSVCDDTTVVSADSVVIINLSPSTIYTVTITDAHNSVEK